MNGMKRGYDDLEGDGTAARVRVGWFIGPYVLIEDANDANCEKRGARTLS